MALVLSSFGTPAVAQVRRLGIYGPGTATESVRHTDADDPASIFLLDENYKFATEASSAAFARDRVYVVDGQYLREFRRNDLVAGPLRSYNAGSQLLDVAIGATDGEILLLTRTALQIIDMGASPSPRMLASVDVANSQPVWGNLLATFGDTAYVADNALKGFRVLDLSNPSAPAQVAQYVTKAKVVGNPNRFSVTDLRMDGATLSLIVAGNLELVSIDNRLTPSQLTSLGVAKFSGVTRGWLAGPYAFLVNGLTVQIVKAAPGQAGFLSEVLRFDTGASITDLFLHEGRLYLLCGKLGYEVWDVTTYAPN